MDNNKPVSRQTPKEKKAKEERIKKQKKKIDDLKTCYNIAFGSPEGRRVLRDIAKHCGHNQTSLVTSGATGEANPLMTNYNEGRKNLYLTIRSHIRNETLKKVEF